ncbi:MAG TPA: triose-phosphate isomerase [Patescibacteria group bacterium]|nr:triose-phosphate isomerase [Patescibacteria group bacterium]
MIFVNFKTYETGTGHNALSLVKILEKVSIEASIKIIPVLQAEDILEASQITKLEIWTQHVDPAEFGAHTGSIIPEAVKEDGAVGTFLNHSEKKYTDFELLRKANQRAKEVGLKTLIFAGNMEELEKVIALKPDFVSYEPPELVGSKTTSVAKEKPEVIQKAVDLAKAAGIPLIVGAGIKSEEDIRKSLELGATGFAIASSIVTSEDPEAELRKLVGGYE